MTDEPLPRMPQLPQAQQAEPGFTGGGQLTIPNLLKTSDGMSDSSFLNTLMPYAAKSSPITRASQDISQEADQ
jgi:hypothetical protein